MLDYFPSSSTFIYLSVYFPLCCTIGFLSFHHQCLGILHRALFFFFLTVYFYLALMILVPMLLYLLLFVFFMDAWKSKISSCNMGQ